MDTLLDKGKKPETADSPLVSPYRQIENLSLETSGGTWTEFLSKRYKTAKALTTRPLSIASSVSTDSGLSIFTAGTNSSLASSVDIRALLPCEFTFLGCKASFTPEDWEGWISHSVSHFAGKSLPLKAVCIFCDDEEGRFFDDRDPTSNWRKRMLHIGKHLQDHNCLEEMRPDFFLINHMLFEKIISTEDYDWIMSYTERPRCDNLVDYDFKIPEMIARERRSDQRSIHDLGKEDRQRRRQNARPSWRGGTKGKTANAPRKFHEDRSYKPLSSLSEVIEHTEQQSIDENNRSTKGKTANAPRKFYEDRSYKPLSSLFEAIEHPEEQSIDENNRSNVIGAQSEQPTPVSPINDFDIIDGISQEFKGHSVLIESTLGQASAHDALETALRCSISEEILHGTVPAVETSSPSTPSTCSDDETDWEEDSHKSIHAETYCDNRAGPMSFINHSDQAQVHIESRKVALVESLMEEALEIFNRNGNSSIRQHGTSPTSSISTSDRAALGERRSNGKGIKRPRGNENDDPSDEDEQGTKRKGKCPEPPSGAPITHMMFACPYRKHNPRKYCIANWKACALTPHTTVGRVKGHLYKYHLIHQCQRCKMTFKSQAELDTHVEADEGCESKKLSDPPEGVTNRMREQIRCRKKAYPGQTEESRWKQIYELLFTGECVPEPYFQPPIDHESHQQALVSSADIEGFQQYLRQIIETEVNNEFEPIEERLRGRLLQVIDQAFLNYRGIQSPNVNIRTAPHTFVGIEPGMESILESEKPVIRDDPILQSSVRTLDPCSLLETSDNNSTRQGAESSSSSSSSYASTLLMAEEVSTQNATDTTWVAPSNFNFNFDDLDGLDDFWLVPDEASTL